MDERVSEGRSPKWWLHVRKWCGGLSLVSATGLSVATFMTFFASHWWLADLCANLRVQGAIGLIATAAVLACLRSFKLAVFQLCLLCVHLPWFLDTSQTTRHVDTVGKGLRLTTANVLTVNRRHQDIKAELLKSNADVVAVVELSSELTAALSTDFSEQYPYSTKEPQDAGGFGIGLYSKLPLESPRIVFFNSDNMPSVAATLTFDGRKVHVLATHTLPPLGSRAFAHRDKQLKMVCDYVRERRQEFPNIPVIVMGDLNLTPWSPVFRKTLQDARLSRAVTGYGLTPTWYRAEGLLFGLVLDHVLTTDCDCVAYDVGNDVGSDHRFVTVELKMP